MQGLESRWLDNYIPQAAKSSHAATKDPARHNKDQRSWVPQLRPRAAKLNRQMCDIILQSNYQHLHLSSEEPVA